VGVQSGKGVSAYLSGKETDLNKIIDRGTLHEGFDIISVGAIPPNPTALLLSDNMVNMIEQLKKEYDYVILDTVPYNLIADAAVANRFADLTIYVIRDGSIDDFGTHEELLSRHGLYETMWNAHMEVKDHA
jgi:Mrp family chromosome partitioning ATPase